MSMYDKNHYNIVISLQLIKINGKKKDIVAQIKHSFIMLMEHVDEEFHSAGAERYSHSTEQKSTKKFQITRFKISYFWRIALLREEGIFKCTFSNLTF